MMQDIFKCISDLCGNQPTFVVGGYCRDMILGIPSSDLDIITEGSGCDLAERFAKVMNSDVDLYRNYGTAKVKVGEIEVEFCGARKEVYERGSRKPIVEDGTMEDDRLRRDLTINSIYLCLNKDRYMEIWDPNDGRKDLLNKICRTPIDPVQTFIDDPLRQLRVIRFATKFGFRIEDKTYEALKICSPEIKNISVERITEELNKILLTDNPGFGFGLLQKVGLLQYILPELSALDFDGEPEKRHKNIFLHTIGVLNQISAKTDKLWLRWAALLHDIGKPSTMNYSPELGCTFYHHDEKGAEMIEDIFKRLHLPLCQLDYVRRMVLLHMRPSLMCNGLETISDTGVRRLISDAQGDIEDLMILASSDYTTRKDEKRKRLEQLYNQLSSLIVDLKERDAYRLFKPVVNGNQIMDLYNIPPSNLISQIKDRMKDDILAGLVENNESDLLNWLKEKRKEFLGN